MKMEKRGQMGIKEIIYIIIGLLVLLLGYILFGYSSDIAGGISNVDDSAIPGLLSGFRFWF